MNKYQQSSLRAQELAFKRVAVVEERLLRYYKRNLAKFCRYYERLMKNALDEEGNIDKAKLRKLKKTIEYNNLSRDLMLEANSFELGPEYDEIYALLKHSYDAVVAETFKLFPQSDVKPPMVSPLLLLLPWTRDGKNFQQRLSRNNELLHERVRAITITALEEGINTKKQTEAYQKAFSYGANNLRRLVETEVEAMYTKALRDSYLALGYKTVRIENDADPCDYCETIEGEYTYVDLEEVEIGVELPPYHPNCRCTFSIF